MDYEVIEEKDSSENSSSDEEEEFVTTGKTVEDCLKPLKEGKIVGKGVYGSVVEACEYGKKCDKYVAKIQKGDQEPYVMLKIQIATNRGDIPKIMPELFWSCKTGESEVIVMERMGGSILSRGWITKKQVLDIINEVTILHGQFFAHQDLKFDNFLYKGNSVYLADFGLSVIAPTHEQVMEDWVLLTVSLILNDIPLPKLLIDKLKKYSEVDVFIGISKDIKQVVRIRKMVNKYRKKRGMEELPILLPGLSDGYLASYLERGFKGLQYNSEGEPWDGIPNKIPIKMPGARGR